MRNAAEQYSRNAPGTAFADDDGVYLLFLCDLDDRLRGFYLVGLDVLLAVMQTLRDEFADSKHRPCLLLKEMVAAGYLGRKSGRGVYNYQA